MQDIENPKKPLIYYYIVGLMIVLFLNAFVFPLMLRQQIEEVDYGTFLTMLDEGSIKEVEIQDRCV